MSSIQERRTALTGESHYEVIEYETGTINTQSNRKILPLASLRKYSFCVIYIGFEIICLS